MEVRQIKVGPDEYLVDVRRSGRKFWEPWNEHILLTRAQVRRFRKFMSEGE